MGLLEGKVGGKVMLISKTSPEYSIRTASSGYTYTTSLIIPRFTEKFVGVYECVSSNSFGTQVASARVYEIPQVTKVVHHSTESSFTYQFSIYTLKEEGGGGGGGRGGPSTIKTFPQRQDNLRHISERLGYFSKNFR